MAKKNHTFGKVLALTTAVAAIGGACYIFRDQIKESNIYKKSSDKFSKLFGNLTDKLCNEEENFFFDDDDDDFPSGNIFSDNAKNGREYTSITINSKEETNDTKEEGTSARSDDTKETDSSAALEMNKEYATPAVSDDTTEEDIPTVSDSTTEEDIPAVSDSTIEEDIPAVPDSTIEEDIPAVSDNTKSEDMKEIFPEDTIPTITFGNGFSTPSSIPEPPTSDFKNAISDEAEEKISAYENEGLSDVSEDPDVLEEQDKLDF